MNSKPKILFYCQHSLGMGHLVRSLAMAESLSERFRVILLNGGRLPRKMRVPKVVEIINLPPLGFDENNQLVSRDRRRSVERAQSLREKIILETYQTEKPQVVLIELFPFGRKKFANELTPLLEAAKGSARIVCSLRDILVGKRRDQARHDERAIETANRFFDAILVHSDADFAKLEESFQTTLPLKTPIFYTGFVAPKAQISCETKQPKRVRQIIVSAGGGMVGESLLRAAIGAHKIFSQRIKIETTIVAGWFLPENDWRGLQEFAKNIKGVHLRRSVPNLRGKMSCADVSISQCGYNTALDILLSGVAALVVPFGDGNGEDEQTKRARNLEDLGALRVLENRNLTAENMAREIEKTLEFQPREISLNMNGGEHSSRVIQNLLPKIHHKESWLAPVKLALENRREPIKIFFRNDDAGIENERLFKLLDVFEKYAMPLDLAVIPKAVSSQFAADLRRRIDSSPHLFAVHQHGYAHLNHEITNRKCEFGAARNKAQQFRDIADGKKILSVFFDDLPQPIFTPPWNRCLTETGEILRELGFKILSRESKAAPLKIKNLEEIPVSIDWFAKRKGVALTRAEIGEKLAREIAGKDTVGVMFHHAVTDASERAMVSEMLALFAEFPNIEKHSIYSLSSASRTEMKSSAQVS
jgi:predicted glycosyltransferase